MSFAPFKVLVKIPTQTLVCANATTPPEQHPAEIPPPQQDNDSSDDKSAPGKKQGENWPPDSIPNPMPGVDPQQTPGIDRLSAG